MVIMIMFIVETMNLSNITEYFTVQAWVKYNGGGSYRSKIIGRWFGNESEAAWNFGLDGTTLNFEARLGNESIGYSSYFFRPNIVLPQNSWHHMAATFSTSTGQVILT